VSIRIVKHGLFDTIQDEGRYGFQHLGINPGGAADVAAFTVANMLAGNVNNEAVIELHYPSSSILFQQNAVIALSGADFGARINDQPVPINTPVLVSQNSVLEFTQLVSGYRCYLSVSCGFAVDEWLGSFSTNTKAQAGGYKGRKLLGGDILTFKKSFAFAFNGRNFLIPGWRADVLPLYSSQHTIRICMGNEYDQLTAASKELLANTTFTITNDSDRMGCRLSGVPLQRDSNIELISYAVTRGTIQLLPGGQLIILTTDHQTTGGYPRIAHAASVDMPTLAQMRPGETIRFAWIGVPEAQALLIQQHRYLLQLQIACNLRLQEFLDAIH